MDGRMASLPRRRRGGARTDDRQMLATAELEPACMTASACRFCGTALRRSFVDLGRSPLSNAFLDRGPAPEMEPHYPLHAYVCENCLLVQLEAFASPATIFTDYAVFLVVLRDLAASRGSLCGADDARACAGRRFAGRGAGQQRRLSAAVLPPAWASAFSAWSPPPMSQRWPRRTACRPRSRIFGVATARRLAAAGRQADLIVRQQRAGARAGPERLRRRTADPAEALRHDHGGVSRTCCA